MKKFKITETDVIDIDRYITEKTEDKRNISEIKKYRRIAVGPFRHFLLRKMFRNYDFRYRKCCTLKEWC